MTNVPLAAWHVVAGPPGIEIGARFYESILGRKSDGRGVYPLRQKTSEIRQKKQLVGGNQPTIRSSCIDPI